MYNKHTLLFALFFLLPFFSMAQDCTVTISGQITDLSTEEPISYATIFLKEVSKGAISDSSGFFLLSDICPGNYHLDISHIGCETTELYLEISQDTSLIVRMDHNAQLLDEVIVSGAHSKTSSQEVQALNEKSISENTDQNLANMLDNISGVSTLRNGNGISKPIIHGLYGNRITILNNGITQNGQQWGIDHSPEIDPLVANKITVIKGVGVLEYQGNSLGSVILVEPNKIENEPHIHGKARYFFESNGLGNGLNLQFQQHNKKIAWRAVGTLKKSGDKRSPDYFLRNTGSAEANIALQLEKQFSESWNSDIYFSSFNTRLGILRGSHIGNLTDLEEALNQDQPFFTEPDFAYAIEAPSQQVNHQLLKVHTQYFIGSNQWIDFSYAGQLDLRKEYDVRRSGRSDEPALSLKQFSNFLEAKYQGDFRFGLKVKTGIQLSRIANTNIPETGVLPLIPDYINYKTGVFGILSKKSEKLFFELGGRFDYQDRRIAAISISLPREIVRYNTKFQNLSTSGGIVYNPIPTIKLAANIGLASRNPEINELYSNGLHQGVSGIEEGNPDLFQEKSFKTTFSFEGRFGKKLFFESLVYYQSISDYIFLAPQDEFRLTIRGAFPVFKYEQTDAQIYGLDLSTTFQVSDKLQAALKYSYIKGLDQTNNIPLIFMPPGNIFTALNYQIPKVDNIQNLEFQINNKWVFEQGNLLPFQDYSPAPPAYNLLGAKISAEKQFSKTRLNIYLKVDNILNVSYRDYLNRQRYFADDLGVNFILGINMQF
ncbi:MAG: TonB-dependent receptor [Saprospiraceae bacterium]|nr:TonB-dependent receptor [Saprospiraceae bacterium]